MLARTAGQGKVPTQFQTLAPDCSLPYSLCCKPVAAATRFCDFPVETVEVVSGCVQRKPYFCWLPRDPATCQGINNRRNVLAALHHSPEMDLPSAMVASALETRMD